MVPIDVKAFKSGNSVALRLPKELGIKEGQEFVVTRIGERLELAPKGSDRLSMKELAARLKEIGPPPGPKVGRLRVMPPKRKGN